MVLVIKFLLLQHHAKMTWYINMYSNNFPNNIWLWPKYQIICTIFFCIWILFERTGIFFITFWNLAAFSHICSSFGWFSKIACPALEMHLFFFFLFFLLKQKKFYYYLCSSFFPAWFPNFSWPFFPNFEVLLYLKSKSPLVVYFVFLAYQNCKCKMTFLFWHIPPEVYHDGSDEACTGKCKCVDHLNHMHQYMQSREIIMNKKIKRNQPFFHMII